MNLLKILFIAALIGAVGCSASQSQLEDTESDFAGTVIAGVLATMAADNNPIPITDVGRTTSLPPIEQERQLVSEYFASLFEVTNSFHRSLDESGMQRQFTSNKFTISGDIDAGTRVMQGFVNRLAALQPSSGPLDLAAAHSLLLAIVEREQRWLYEYADAVSKDDSAAIIRLDGTYRTLLPVSDLDAADSLLFGVAADYNVSPTLQRGDIQVTLLHPAYLGYDDESRLVQYAIDLMMADSGLPTVTASTAPMGSTIGEWATWDFDPGVGTTFLFPDHLRQDSTNCDYEWNVTGQVTARTGC